jgi:membrane protease YdiL (CAAX protease family)
MRVLGAFGLLLLWLVVPPLASPSAPATGNIIEIVSRGILPSLAMACLLLGGAAALLRWRGLGLGRPRPGTLRLLWLPGLYLLLTAALLATTGLPPAGFMLIVLVNMLLVGLSEELMFRGFLYSGLRDRLSLWPAAILTSALFGMVHVLNVAVTGHLRLALLQSVSAAMLGLLLLALRLRMGSLWPAILLHAFWNFGLLLLGRDAIPPTRTTPCRSPPRSAAPLRAAPRALRHRPASPPGASGRWSRPSQAASHRYLPMGPARLTVAARPWPRNKEMATWRTARTFESTWRSSALTASIWAASTRSRATASS